MPPKNDKVPKNRHVEEVGHEEQLGDDPTLRETLHAYEERFADLERWQEQAEEMIKRQEETMRAFNAHVEEQKETNSAILRQLAELTLRLPPPPGAPFQGVHQDAQEDHPRVPPRGRELSPPILEESDDEDLRGEAPLRRDEVNPRRPYLRPRRGGRGHYGGRFRDDGPRGRQGRMVFDDERMEAEYHRAPNRPNYMPQQPRNDFKIKVELPSFSGSMDTETFLEWIEAVENYFEVVEVAEDQKVAYVAYKLQGGAAIWWRREQETRRKNRIRPIRDWPEMEQMLRSRFLPPDYDQILYNKYLDCYQGSRSVDEYSTEFLRLCARNDFDDNGGPQIARYIRGLRVAIRERMEADVFLSHLDAYNKARKLEEVMRNRRVMDLERKPWETSPTPQIFPSNLKEMQLNPPVQERRKTTTPKPTVESSSREKGKSADITCYKCLQKGHVSSSCPLRKAMLGTYKDKEQEEGEYEFCAPEDEEVDGFEEEEEVLGVLQRYSLIAHKEDESPRPILFRDLQDFG